MPGRSVVASDLGLFVFNTSKNVADVLMSEFVDARVSEMFLQQPHAHDRVAHQGFIYISTRMRACQYHRAYRKRAPAFGTDDVSLCCDVRALADGTSAPARSSDATSGTPRKCFSRNLAPSPPSEDPVLGTHSSNASSGVQIRQLPFSSTAVHSTASPVLRMVSSTRLP